MEMASNHDLSPKTARVWLSEYRAFLTDLCFQSQMVVKKATGRDKAQLFKFVGCSAGPWRC
jgi:hypothetical protein